MLTNPTILTPPTFADITHKTLTTCVDMKIDASKHPINSQAARLSSTQTTPWPELNKPLLAVSPVLRWMLERTASDNILMWFSWYLPKLVCQDDPEMNKRKITETNVKQHATSVTWKQTVQKEWKPQMCHTLSNPVLPPLLIWIHHLQASKQVMYT